MSHFNRCILSASFAFAATCGAQSDSAQPQNKPPVRPAVFEAASVKLAQPNAPYQTDNDLFGTAGWSGAGLRATAILNVYLLFAFNIADPVQGRALWDSLPVWSKTDKYEIQATAYPGVSRDEVRAMMRNLLAERFALRVHHELRQADALTIALDQSGTMKPGLRAHPANQTCINDPNRPDEIDAPAPDGQTPRFCGVTVWTLDGQRHLQIVDATMAEIATALADESLHGGYSTPHAGKEMSGLAGRYDLDLHYVPSDRAEVAGGPTLKEALKKQTGLTLTERKQPMQILIVDHLERPTPN